MGRGGSVDFKELKKLQRNLQRLEESQLDKFCRDCAKELAARLIGKAIKRTPVDTGVLRQGWNGVAYARSLPVIKAGDTYIIEIINPIKYASFIEFGHRTRNHKGWVKGRYMMTISAQELRGQVDVIIEKKLLILLKGVFDV
ncbi:TPA: HK97 gp10 family phage protein [Clostridioides difficile]|nr:HK97 gp10 family phage protein [Clostridioides difficile]